MGKLLPWDHNAHDDIESCLKRVSFIEHSISLKSHALSSSCNIDHFVVQLVLRLRQGTYLFMRAPSLLLPPSSFLFFPSSKA